MSTTHHNIHAYCIAVYKIATSLLCHPAVVHTYVHMCTRLYAGVCHVHYFCLAGLSTSCGWPFTWRRSCCHPLCADKDAREGGCPSLEELWVLHTRLCVQVSSRMQEQKTMAMYAFLYYYTVYADTVMCYRVIFMLGYKC